ncbi:MAG: GNAT family N-acetyltransferase [Calditrichaeota bacterium]|nr:GNAT family N-acetyltransferase [Calditrichota bacterium]
MNTPVIIAPLSSFDIAAAAEIVAKNKLWQRYGTDYDQAYSILLKALQEERTIYSARIYEQVAGFVWFDRQGTFYHSGYIRWIAVHPDFQGKGVGKILMQFAEDKIFQKGPNVFLLVSDFNTEAQGFYQKRGYKKVGELEDFYKRGITEYIYRKSQGPIVR